MRAVISLLFVMVLLFGCVSQPSAPSGEAIAGDASASGATPPASGQQKSGQMLVCTQKQGAQTTNLYKSNGMVAVVVDGNDNQAIRTIRKDGKVYFSMDIFKKSLGAALTCDWLAFDSQKDSEKGCTQGMSDQVLEETVSKMECAQKSGQDTGVFQTPGKVCAPSDSQSVALLGFFPCQVATDAKASQSDAYWRSAARPFMILEHAQKANDPKITLVIQNAEAVSIRLDSISLVSDAASGSLNNGNGKYLSSGERAAIEVPLSKPCSPNSGYEYYVNLTYSNKNGIDNLVQYGYKPLVGKCA